MIIFVRVIHVPGVSKFIDFSELENEARREYPDYAIDQDSINITYSSGHIIVSCNLLKVEETAPQLA